MPGHDKLHWIAFLLSDAAPQAGVQASAQASVQRGVQEGAKPAPEAARPAPGAAGPATGEMAGEVARGVAGAYGLGLGLLQFTPRVALLEDAVLMEAGASLRLFGGARALHRRLRQETPALGASGLAWAPTGLAALAKARALRQGWKPPAAPSSSSAGRLPAGCAVSMQAMGRLEGGWLDTLPLETLADVGRHRAVLARLGCRTLGDVRQLPREGLARRFDARLLSALDRAYGRAPETYAWLALPDVFEAGLELVARVEDGPALMAGAQRLLLQLQGWLRARRAGALAVTLRWRHDTFRARDSGPGGQLTVRTAEPTQAVAHLARLLAEHLARVELAAPVSDLALEVRETGPMAETAATLVHDDGRARGEALPLALERIAARLGPLAVEQAALRPDHRLEWMQRWHAAGAPAQGAPGAAAQGAARLPVPVWLAEPPERLEVRGDRPWLGRQPLRLLLGPDRIETGWWHRAGDGQQQALMVARDYWLAHSPGAGLLWVFQERLAREAAGWYLHGRFG